MKDLKHYFADTVKACEAGNDGKEVREKVSPKSGEEEAKANSPLTPGARKKRGRVKIKISQSNARGPVCDIVESNTDLVDKTPSPFTPKESAAKGLDSDTPKRSASLPRKPSRANLLKAASKHASSHSENDDGSPRKSNGVGGANGAILREKSENAESVGGEREESNAFQVLMTRKKLVQYNPPVTLTPQEEEAAARAAEENKSKLKQNKEKLIAMADKKGYSKRKLEETEEAEKIERRMEKRARVFKQIGKKEGANDKSLERRVSPGSLHNYFSKATPEQKELTDVSTLAVQETRAQEEVVLVASEDDCEIVEEAGATGNAVPASDTQVEEAQAKPRAAKKPRWSLRINLGGEGATAKTDSSDDKTGTGKRESKLRRSKAKPINYEDNDSSDLEVSNAKSVKKRKSSAGSLKNKSVTKPELVEADSTQSQKQEEATTSDVEVIEVKVAKPLPPEKLAPLFVKRQKPDPAVLEARRLFLHSVPTENESPRKERKAPVLGTPLLPFPSISHVTQNSCESSITQASDFRTKFTAREVSHYTPSFNLREFTSVTNLNANFTRKTQDPKEKTKEKVEDVLSEIENRCEDARAMWKRISGVANGEESRRVSPKRKGKKRRSNEKKSEASEAISTYSEDSWLQKYRPLSTGDIVGNEEAAEKLRKWLSGWKAPLRKEDASSGDEFYSSDCSFASNVENNQVAVLLGPHGCGKTASVYAVAEELGYSILEINASSKRAGKKILRDLEEATKSHRVKKPGSTMSLTPLVKEKRMPKNSLILVEDVDLVFEEDEGFVSATFQLASNTKRPIVMTGRDTCSHLNKMAPQQHRIYYQTTVGSRVSALLELITLAESGCRLPRPCLDRLLQNGDLRKALLQLQYLLLSGKPQASEVPTDFHRTLWQDMRHCIYKPAVKASKKSSKRKLNASSNKKSKVVGEESVLRDMTKRLDEVSFLSTLIEVEDPALEVPVAKLEPSLSLDESTHSYCSTRSTSAEIAKWLKERAMSGAEVTDSSAKSSQMLRQLSLKKELNLGVDFALSQVSPHTLDGRALAVDYLPSLRAICRAEEVRLTTNSKRGNRFYHYLQSLRLPSTSTRPNVLAAACRIMSDKNDSESS